VLSALADASNRPVGQKANAEAALVCPRSFFFGFQVAVSQSVTAFSFAGATARRVPSGETARSFYGPRTRPERMDLFHALRVPDLDCSTACSQQETLIRRECNAQLFRIFFDKIGMKTSAIDIPTAEANHRRLQPQGVHRPVRKQRIEYDRLVVANSIALSTLPLRKPIARLFHHRRQ
jgi:hypothetical protein